MGLLLCVAQYAFGATKEEILQALVSSHTGAFGKDDIYKNPISADELRLWNSAITEGKKFVESHCKNQFGIKDGDLMKALSTIEKANIDLVNTIRLTRALLQSPSELKRCIDALDKIKLAMIKVQKDLKGATFILNSEEKKLASDILASIALFIETTAAKAIKDTTKKM